MDEFAFSVSTIVSVRLVNGNGLSDQRHIALLKAFLQRKLESIDHTLRRIKVSLNTKMEVGNVITQA